MHKKEAHNESLTERLVRVEKDLKRALDCFKNGSMVLDEASQIQKGPKSSEVKIPYKRARIKRILLEATKTITSTETLIQDVRQRIRARGVERDLNSNLDTAIDELPLSIRTLNCLLHRTAINIKTVRDVLITGPKKVRRMPKLGKNCFNELIEILYSKGYLEAPTRDAWIKRQTDLYRRRHMR